MAGRDVFSIVLVRTFLSLWNVFNQSDINREKEKKNLERESGMTSLRGLRRVASRNLFKCIVSLNPGQCFGSHKIEAIKGLR